jgi:hypothetical protein
MPTAKPSADAIDRRLDVRRLAPEPLLTQILAYPDGVALSSLPVSGLNDRVWPNGSVHSRAKGAHPECSCTERDHEPEPTDVHPRARLRMLIPDTPPLATRQS